MSVKFTNEEVRALLSLLVYIVYLVYAIYVWVKLYRKEKMSQNVHLSVLFFFMGIFVSVTIADMNIVPIVLSTICMIVLCKISPILNMGLNQPFPAAILFLVYGISHGTEGILVTYFVLWGAFLLAALFRGISCKNLMNLRHSQVYPFVTISFLSTMAVLGCHIVSML